MNLQKMRTEIVDNGFKIVGAFTEGCNAECEQWSDWWQRISLKEWADYLATRTPLASLLCKTSVLSMN
jgi:hypothetical protein